MSFKIKKNFLVNIFEKLSTLNKVFCVEHYCLLVLPACTEGCRRIMRLVWLQGSTVRWRLRPWGEAGQVDTNGLMWKTGARVLRNVMRFSEHIILDHNIYPVIHFSQQKPDTGVVFSNNCYFKCNSASTSHIFRGVVRHSSHIY